MLGYLSFLPCQSRNKVPMSGYREWNIYIQFSNCSVSLYESNCWSFSLILSVPWNGNIIIPNLLSFPETTLFFCSFRMPFLSPPRGGVAFYFFFFFKFSLRFIFPPFSKFFFSTGSQLRETLLKTIVPFFRFNRINGRAKEKKKRFCPFFLYSFRNFLFRLFFFGGRG